MTPAEWRQATLAGIVASFVGFSSAFAVVIAGLRAVGATPDQAASGLFIVTLTTGIGGIAFSLATRRPIALAWSTPGAALLATMAAPKGGFAVAVGAFAVTGVLLAATALIPPLARLVQQVPTAIANAMLAGVVLDLCIDPLRQWHLDPWGITIVFVVWALLTRLLPRWAVPGAVVGAIAVMLARHTFASLSGGDVVPHLVWTTPEWSGATMLSIAIPLYLVTMTSQNLPGAAVMKSLGYALPWRSAIAYTGAATTLGAPLGGHAINLSAIVAALTAGPEAGRDPRHRWVAGVSAGTTYVVLGLCARGIVAVGERAPAGLFAAIAAVGLLGTLANSARSALEREDTRAAAALTIVVATSGLTVAGIGGAFWALVVGCAVCVLNAVRLPRRT
ncbi:MAG TPA: benzoate/H(+) symporter BenE family transporter [Marmoricola sp.]